MKTNFIFALFFFSTMPFLGLAQLTFSVSPGFQLNGANIGYQFNDNLIGTFGFQYLGASYKIVDPDFEDKFGAALIIPGLGIKYLINRTNQIQPYLNLSVSKPFITGKITYDGEEDEEFKDVIKNISLFGVEFGFGVEYFFDSNFSIGGEYGFRHFGGSYNASDEFDDITVKGTINPTYTKLTLNFYFNRAED